MNPENLLYVYLSVEVLKLLAARFISHKEQMSILKEISRFQRDSSLILEQILLEHDIKPKEGRKSEEGSTFVPGPKHF